MSNQQLTKEALQLPPIERVQLAQELWESVFEVLVPAGDPNESAHFAEAVRRADEIDSGRVKTIPCDEVMTSLYSKHRLLNSSAG